MTTEIPVSDLLTDGQSGPLGVDEAPLLSWSPDERQAFVHVQVLGQDSTLVWDSGVVRSRVPELRAPVEIRSRRLHRWRVRISPDARIWTAWSAEAQWENGLLAPDWAAEWIARAVGPEHRIARSITRGEIEWANPASVLEQRFTAPGPILSVHADLTGIRDVDVEFQLEVVDSVGSVVGTQITNRPQHIWDRFMNYVELDPPAPAGEYGLRLTVEQGKVGWHTDPTPARDPQDDGVSPVSVTGPALTNGVQRRGRRAIGLETAPAPNPAFRTTFHVPANPAVASARLYGVALGNGMFRVNGILVGDELLEPAPTDFRSRVLYRAWDVTPLLHPGENILTIDAGRATFALRGANVWGWNLAPWHAEPMARAQLEWAATDGSREVVTTGPGWEVSAGPTTSEHYYGGELSVSAADEVQWGPVTPTRGPNGMLRAAPLPPIRVVDTQAPISAETSEDGRRVVYDFGRVLTGRMRCRLRGTAGSSVRVTSGEQLSSAGRVVCENSLAGGAAQVDEHRFEVADDLRWEPRFSYRGFRWVEIEVDGEVAATDVDAVVLHTDVAVVGEFSTDVPVLDWMDGALRRTFLNNLQGIPTDTPIFEKNGWTADAHLATEALLQQLDLRRTFSKWVQDHADSQDESGSIPQIVPSPGWATAPDPAWSGSAILIPWQLYWEYGELNVLERFAPMVQRYADALLTVADGSIWPARSWGDWLAPGHDLPPEGAAPAATAMMAHVLQTASAIFAALGWNDHADAMRDAAGRTAVAYHDAYFDSVAKRYAIPGVEYRQSLNIFPLAFGLVPPEHRVAVAASLSEDIEHRTNGHLNAGALGTRHLLSVLDEMGRPDLALTVATTPTRPGWGAWFHAGESTLMESWDTSARSRNHYFLGGGFAWVHKRVGGMAPVAPGWAIIDVDPIDDPRVGRGSRRHRSVRGEASVSWRRTDTALHIDLVVPPGSEAQVRMPNDDVVIGPGTHRVIRPTAAR